VEVVISVDSAHLATIGVGPGALRAAGLRDEQVLEAAGVITGQADDVDSLRQVAGVAAVEVARGIDIGPPDAPVQ
jgi:precorrin-3B methylase